MQLRKLSLFNVLWFLNLLIAQNVMAYTPESISGKYETGTIGSGDFYYSHWMPTMKNFYGSESAVREAFAPNAMVDSIGDLYTISLCGFNSSEGPRFEIEKHSDDSKTDIPNIKSDSFNFYPWTKIPGVTPKCAEDPAFNHSSFSGISVSEDTEKTYFKDYIHNAFLPCLAQEVDGSSEYLYGFIYIPTTRLMGIQVDKTHYSGAENGGTEGVLFFKISKDLSNIKTNYIPQTTCRAFQYNYLRLYTVNWNYKLQPQFGNFTAYCYGNSVYLYNLCNINNVGVNAHYTYHSIFNIDFDKDKISFSKEITTNGAQYNISANPKFIKLGDYVYSMEMRDGYTPFLNMQSVKNGSVDLKSKCYKFLYLETISQGHSSSLYHFDYHVFDAGDNKRVWCVLGFQSSNSYSDLRANEGWDMNYLYSNNDSSVSKKISLILWSLPLSSGVGQENFGSYTGNATECAQNIIYSTNIDSWTATPVTDTSSNDSKRLYLNTQKMCVYNKESKNYIIYAYCYPGKSGKGNHLYIGYAPYVITSDARLRLLTKVEFKDTDDNSFITDCSRIISLDCKNGHVWLTYMNSDNTNYKYFYIKASDLVGE